MRRKRQEDRGIPGCHVRLAGADWNNDGRLDLLVGTFRQEGDRLGSNVFVFLRE